MEMHRLVPFPYVVGGMTVSERSDDDNRELVLRAATIAVPGFEPKDPPG